MASFFAAYHRGERPVVEEYAQRHPDLAQEIREVLPPLLLMEEAGNRAGKGEPTGERAQGAAETREVAPGQLGEYRIVREVGRGGMGVVYEAVQESLGRRVALKVLPKDFLGDARRLERFLREAKAAARLQHPHIVPVFAVGEHEGTHYYVMQFIQGKGLDAVLREVEPSGAAKSSPEDFVKAARLGLQVAEALAYAHTEGILHRDIKPSNLLVDAQGEVWVTDFGLAKAEGSGDLTRTGDIVGTLRYMAPERLRGWSDVRSDVYSLGLTLYEVATRAPAFEASERSSLIRKVLEETPPRPRRRDPGIPIDLETIILKASEKEPGHRYVSAGEMALDLGRFLAGEPIRARAVGNIERTWRWCRRNPVLAGLASSVAALVVTVAVVASAYAMRLGESNREARENLWSAYAEQARALRFSGRAGRRFEALDVLRKAAAIRPARELRDEAIACMALEDVRVAREWKDEGRGTYGLAFDSRLERFVVTPADGSPGLELRAVRDGALLQKLDTGVRAHDCVLFSPCDRYLAAAWGGSSGTECLFEASGSPRPLRVESVSSSKAVAFSSDECLLALGQADGGVRILDLKTGTETGRVSTPFSIEHLAFRPDGSQLAVASHSNGQLLVARLQGGERVILRELPRFVSCLTWSPGGELLAAACMDNFTYLFDAATWEVQSVLERHDGSVISCAFNRRGDLIATSGWDGTTRFWDPWSGRLRLQVAGSLCGGFSEDDERIGFVRSHTHWGIWEVAAGREIRVLGRGVLRTNDYPPLDFSPGGRLMAFATDHGFGVWDAEASRNLAFVGSTRIFSVLFEPGGAGLIVSDKGGLCRWPLQGEGERLRLGPPLRIPEVVRGGHTALSRDGRRLILAEDVGMHAFVFDWNKREVVQRLAHPFVRYGDVDPSGELAATGTWNGRGVKIWNASSGALIGELPISSSAEVHFSADGLSILTCDYREYCLWATATLTPLYKLPMTDEGAPHPAAIAPTGGWVALSRALGVAEVRDLSTGDLIARLETPDLSPFGALRFSRDGARLAASTRTSIQLWDLRKVREGLRSLGLSWDRTGAAAAAAPRGGRLDVEVALGSLAEPQAGVRRERLEKVRGWFAEQDLKTLAEPGDAWNYYYRGSLRDELSDWKGAVADFEKCLELDSTCYLAMNDLAWLLVIGPEVLRNPERAAALARECMRYDPNPATTKNTLGAALYRLGKYEEAVRWLEESARQSSLNDLALNALFLAMCHWKLGNPAIAKRYQRQALESSGELAAPDRDLEIVQEEAKRTLEMER